MADFLLVEERIEQALATLGPAVLGQRVKRARIREGMSIRDLAQRARVSKTSIVRLEQGQPCQPTTVIKVCEGLGLHLERFLEHDDRDEVTAIHRLADDRWYDLVRFADGPLGGRDRPLTKVEREQFARDGGLTPFLIFKSHLSEGRAWASLIEVYQKSEVRSHPGEEFVFVLSGSAQITVGSRSFLLQKGECMSFWSTEEHTYAPAPGSSPPARILCVRVSS